jgi:hypothetical protein
VSRLTALEDMFRSRADAKLLGVFSPNFHESPTLAQVFAGGPFMMSIGPLQYDKIDIGERRPVRCLRNGLWLARHDGQPFDILLAPSVHFGQVGGVHVEVAVPGGESGLALSQRPCSPISSVASAVAGRTEDASFRQVLLERFPKVRPLVLLGPQPTIPPVGEHGIQQHQSLDEPTQRRYLPMAVIRLANGLVERLVLDVVQRPRWRAPGVIGVAYLAVMSFARKSCVFWPCARPVKVRYCRSRNTPEKTSTWTRNRAWRSVNPNRMRVPIRDGLTL